MIKSVGVNAIHTVGSLGLSAGGPSRTVPALCDSVMVAAPENILKILTSDGTHFGLPSAPSRAVVSYYPSNSSVSEIGSEISSLISGVSNCILHDHGQWLRVNRASAACARRFGMKRIVSPRGMLSPWALKHRRLKKLAAWWVFARRDLMAANVLHATSQLEADELRMIGVRQPIAVIPNGVQMSNRPLLTIREKVVLFLSRLHVKKGVGELVEAWRSANTEGWTLVLAGPDEGRMLAELNLAPNENIRYIGEVHGTEKHEWLERASIFVLPSRSENFGVVVAESLYAGTPVITTKFTPWEVLVEQNCGWWIELNKSVLRRTLEQAIQTSPSELLRMGLAGRNLVERCFGWESIGRQMALVYRWMMGSDAMPSFVQSDEE